MGVLSYFGIKIKPKPKNKTAKEEIQELNEAHKQLMDELQIDKDDFFDADKFVCDQKVFDLIRRLPNFEMADPRVPESGYYTGKPIYIHLACEPNTFVGIKTPKESSGELVYEAPCINSERETYNMDRRLILKPYVVSNCNKIQVHTEPNTGLGLKIAARLVLFITISLTVGVLILAMIAV